MPGRICLVTGATSGIGQATAQTLTGHGASEVILVLARASRRGATLGATVGG